MKRKCCCKDPDNYLPIDCLMVGDVVKWGPAKTLRKVRSTNHCELGHLRTIGFAKLQESWTPRACTFYTRYEAKLLYRGTVAQDVSLCTTKNECHVQRQFDESLDISEVIPFSRIKGTVW